MPFWEDFLPLFNRTISVEPFVSANSGDKPTYGTAVEYKCFIRDDVKVWKWEDGTEQQSRRTVYVNGESIGRKDKITLPSGYTPQVCFPVYLIRRDDDVGYHHTEIYL